MAITRLQSWEPGGMPEITGKCVIIKRRKILDAGWRCDGVEADAEAAAFKRKSRQSRNVRALHHTAAHRHPKAIEH